MKCAKLIALSFFTVVLIAAGNGARSLHAAQLQWGFDSLFGSVGSINNDGTGGPQLGGQLYAGRGTPSYSFDTPPANRLQNTTGIGSVDLFGSNATLRTVGTVSDLVTNASLLAAGGITLQAWYRQTANPSGGAGIGAIIDIGGAMLLRETNTGFSVLVNSSGLPTPSVAVTQAARQGDWNHVAAIWAGNGTTNTLSLYLNGTLVQSLSHPQAPVMNQVGALPITIGGRDADNLFDLEGLIFEPTITLGVVPVSEFTIKPVPEPSSLLLAGLGGLAAVSMRRKRTK
jgi:hypothetical protein